MNLNHCLYHGQILPYSKSVLETPNLLNLCIFKDNKSTSTSKLTNISEFPSSHFYFKTTLSRYTLSAGGSLPGACFCPTGELLRYCAHVLPCALVLLCAHLLFCTHVLYCAHVLYCVHALGCVHVASNVQKTRH